MKKIIIPLLIGAVLGLAIITPLSAQELSHVTLTNFEASEIIDAENTSIIGYVLIFLISDPASLSNIVFEIEFKNKDEVKIDQANSFQITVGHDEGYYLEYDNNRFPIENNRVEIFIDTDPVEYAYEKVYKLTGYDNTGLSTGEVLFER